MRNYGLAVFVVLIALSLNACGASDTGPGGEAGAGGAAGGAGGDGGGGSPAVHEVLALEPDHGPIGTSVRVVGEGFGADGSKVKVVFESGEASTVLNLAADGSEFTTSVPGRAATGPVLVLVDHGQGFVSRNGPTFTVETDLPQAQIQSVQPAVATEGVTSAHTVRGSNFVSQSQALLAGSEVGTRFVSTTQLEVTLSATSLATPGELALSVRNPDGLASNTAPIEVLAALDVVGARATSATAVEVQFNKPIVTTGLDAEFAFTILPPLRVLGFDVSEADPSTVILTTEENGPSWTMALEVADDVRAQDGAAIRKRTAEFQSFAPAP